VGSAPQSARKGRMVASAAWCRAILFVSRPRLVAVQGSLRSTGENEEPRRGMKPPPRREEELQ